MRHAIFTKHQRLRNIRNTADIVSIKPDFQLHFAGPPMRRLRQKRGNEMSENVDTAALLAALQGQLRAAQPASGWAQPQTAVPVIDKINVPIKMQTPIGEVRVGLEIPITPEIATPEGIMSILQWLQSQGMPIDAWQNRQWNNRNGGGEWGRGGNGGYGGGGRRW